MTDNIKSFLAVLCLSIVFGSFTISAAEPAPIRIFLNGTEIAFDQPPVIENGRTLVPARAILEALGLTLAFDESTGTVTAENAQTAIVMTIGSTAVTVNQEKMIIDAPAKILGGRTLVPLRFIGESMNLTVDWDESARTIHLDDKTPPAPEPEPTPIEPPVAEPEKPKTPPAPKTMPEPSKPVPDYHMSDADIRIAMDTSRRGLIHFNAEIFDRYYLKDSDIKDISSQNDSDMPEISVDTPYLGVVGYPFELRYAKNPIEDMYLWRIERGDKSQNANDDKYFSEMKALYEKTYDSGDRIWIQVHNLKFRDFTITQEGKNIDFITEETSGYRKADFNDIEGMNDATHQFLKNRVNSRDVIRLSDITADDVEKASDEVQEFFKNRIVARLGIDLNAIDPEKPLELTIRSKKSQFGKHVYTHVATIDLKEYK